MGRSRDHAQPNTPIKFEPMTVGLRTAGRCILFQPHPHGPSMGKNPGTLQASQKRHMGPI